MTGEPGLRVRLARDRSGAPAGLAAMLRRPATRWWTETPDVVLCDLLSGRYRTAPEAEAPVGADRRTRHHRPARRRVASLG